MSSREAEFREMLVDVHDQLLRRDEELRTQFEAKLEEQTAWARRSAEEVAERDAMIRELQAEARELAAQLERLRRSWPVRLSRALRQVTNSGAR